MLVLSILKQLIGVMHLMSLRLQTRVPPYGSKTIAGDSILYVHSKERGDSNSDIRSFSSPHAPLSPLGRH